MPTEVLDEKLAERADEAICCVKFGLLEFALHGVKPGQTPDLEKARRVVVAGLVPLTDYLGITEANFSQHLVVTLTNVGAENDLTQVAIDIQARSPAGEKIVAVFGMNAVAEDKDVQKC